MAATSVVTFRDEWVLVRRIPKLVDELRGSPPRSEGPHPQRFAPPLPLLAHSERRRLCCPSTGLQSRGLTAVASMAQASAVPGVVGVHATLDQLAP